MFQKAIYIFGAFTIAAGLYTATPTVINQFTKVKDVIEIPDEVSQEVPFSGDDDLLTAGAKSADYLKRGFEESKNLFGGELEEAIKTYKDIFNGGFNYGDYENLFNQ